MLVTGNRRPQLAHESKILDLEIPIAKSSQALQTPPAIAPVSRPVDKLAHHAPTKLLAKPTAIDAGDDDKPAKSSTSTVPQLIAGGEGRVEVAPLSSNVQAIYWTKHSEHFPVPSQSIIKLPTGKPKPIPKIQHVFETESPAAKADREAKLDIIKGVFKRSWDGYREYAWLQDELSPVSGKFRNPFASWGATLVDALDTLWIMGMKKEFEEAAKAVDEIDFTTTPRPDIPLFETTIRYLGGLLAAYDLSEKKYKNLLDKAVELAEVLLSTFDTPNRMPETYYYWRPTFSSQSHRASNRVVLAEIGSLSVEFTRLAQLTGDNKYYDAIARITDNLEEFQNNTRLPGMWPTYLDASGCKRIEYTSEVDTPLQAPLEIPADVMPKEPTTTGEELSPNGMKYKPLDLPAPIEFQATTPEEELSPNGKKYKPLDLPPPIVFGVDSATAKASPTALIAGEPGKGKIGNWGEDTAVAKLTKDTAALEKRQLENEGLNEKVDKSVTATSSSASASPTLERPECEEQGFASSSHYSTEEYTLGGMSDSTYEYLPKEWLLLGAQVDKYRTMYEQSIDVVKSNLLFRPMLPKEDDILFSGKLLVPAKKPKLGYGELEGENAHLTCFAGGMFGMGAKIFDRPEDLEIAKKLTEGCVWSYDMTSTGIMPEAFITVPCESMKHCEWNETKYWDVVDPGAEARLASYKLQMEQYEISMASASAKYEAQLAEMTASPSKTGTELFEAAATPLHAASPRVTAELESGIEKRQIDDEPKYKPETVPEQKVPQRNIMVGVGPAEPEEAEGPPTRVQDDATTPGSPTLPVFPNIYSPKPPLTHEKYVKNRIQEERLPPGVTAVRARNYILR